ncbi:hypothetical protein BT63DRAFT_416786 [Microthyrium microscopicum]|uniref:lytic cellulose monooxygenase (C4-dehydrogenating) n=1 Tax=Microthyrium microscopicum TaxID=703497 RepID=A0A6A6U546_9PEZI|nr:hypothetical protein BT63DRAFT_416786 [Microthyrium microscopicum]
MKSFLTVALSTGVALAHSGVWNLDIDGTNYPARDTRMDGKLGAKRIEWGFRDAGVPWGPVSDVNSAGITCGLSPTPPALKAVARAGANVTVQWSGIVRTHYGPVMTYLALLPSPDAKPQSLSFFKIAEHGYNAVDKLWANEELNKHDRKDTFQLPSDIAPGTYVLRTELMSLHYATKTGPQFYSHCFNIGITSNGTAKPQGVKFPGGYTRSDPSLVYALYTPSGAQTNWESYKVPGPPKYAGKYDAPTGPVPKVSDKERGVFPPEFQAKYEAFKKKEDEEGLDFNTKLNKGQEALGHKVVDAANEASLQPIFSEHIKAQQGMNRELAALRAEAVKLGIAE